MVYLHCAGVSWWSGSNWFRPELWLPLKAEVNSPVKKGVSGQLAGDTFNLIDSMAHGGR